MHWARQKVSETVEARASPALPTTARTHDAAYLRHQPATHVGTVSTAHGEVPGGQRHALGGCGGGWRR
eukprot:3741867-Prymnesium_polylepis.1